METSYACLWEFQVKAGLEPEFERDYGSSGAWAQLFRQSPGYIGTSLFKDRSIPGRYVTVDRWSSEESYQTFLDSFSEQYKQLDNECERMTVGERSLGTFDELLPHNSFKPSPLRGAT